MQRVMIRLDEDLVNVLARLASSERRDTREQIARCLEILVAGDAAALDQLREALTLVSARRQDDMVTRLVQQVAQHA